MKTESGLTHPLRKLAGAVLAVAVIGLGGCAATVSEMSPPLDHRKPFYVMPFTNQSNMPMAQSQVEEIMASALSARGLSVKVYPKSQVNDIQASLEPEKRFEAAQTWVSQQPEGYLIQGSVHEWQYKFGLDGEPAVGFTMTVNDMNQVELWRASTSRSGWGRESISRIGIKAAEDMADQLTLTE
jgi:hypothetical protein